MTDQLDFPEAQARLDECERTVERLHKMCCEPDRSPRMQQILRDSPGRSVTERHYLRPVAGSDIDAIAAVLRFVGGIVTAISPLNVVALPTTSAEQAYG